MAVDTELRSSSVPEVSDSDERLQYRALSAGAVVSVVMGVLSFITIPTALKSVEACILVCPLPLAGLILGVRSLLRIRREPEVLTGLRLAVAGSTLSAFFLVGGMTLAIVIYTTEVPDGYTRTSFVGMKPPVIPGRTPPIVPPEIMELNGKRIFIKGYMRPPTQRYQIDNFLLVRDNQECCFGDLSKVKYYDQMVVNLTPPMRTNYSTRLFRLAGVLKIEPRNAYPDSDKPVYSLTAEYLK